MHVGIGGSDRVSAVMVEWPDGVHESFTGVGVDRLVTLQRGTGQQGATK